MIIHSFGLTEDEEKLFQKIRQENPRKSASALIRHRLFGRRNRNHRASDLLDTVFLSQISNLLHALRDNLKRGAPVEAEVEEIQKLLSAKINTRL
jgi:hypothetical protein